MPLSATFEFECPVKTHYGQKALEHLPFELRNLDVKKPLVIGGATASREGRLRHVLNAFRDGQMTVGVVENVPPGDPQATVSQLAAIYRDKDCDAVVAVGQGGTIDTAKWLSLAATTGEASLDPYFQGRALPRRLKPLAVIPGAMADGYELSGHLRAGQTRLRSIPLMPRLLFLDERTVGAPDDAALTETALAALTHALESCFGPQATPMSAIYARTAARLAVEVLHQLAHRGDRSARLGLTTAHAAALSGCALGAAPRGLTHRLAAALGQTGKATASQAAGIVLSYAIEYRAVNGLLDGDDLLALLGGQDRQARTPKGQRGPAAIYFLRNLLNLLYERTDGRIKRTLRDLGFSSEDLREAVVQAQAAGKGELPVEAAAILDHALEGRPFLELN